MTDTNDTTTRTAPAYYTTAHVAAAFDMPVKKLRRYMRKCDIRIGSGARHVFTKREFNTVVKTVGARINATRGGDA